MSLELIRLPHSILNLSDSHAIAFMILLHSKPAGFAIRGQEVMDKFKIGKSIFYRARKILLENNLITEKKKFNRLGHFDGVYYQLVPHETVVQKIEHGDQPYAENQNTVDLARSVLKHNSSLKNNSSCKNKASKINASCKINSSSLLNASKYYSNSRKFSQQNSYPDDFEKLWKSFTPTLGAVGSKSAAFKEFKKLSMNPGDVDWLVSKIRAEIKRKKQIRAEKQFDPSFAHVCRVLKNRDWESWVDSPTSVEEMIL